MDTYFFSVNAHNKRAILQSDSMARLLVDVLYSYRTQRRYLLHHFVVMPDHLHILATPLGIPLERAVQFIKGGFSFRAKRELEFAGEIWQPKYHDRRVRDLEELLSFKRYIHQNPVKRGLVAEPEDYPWSSASNRFELDDVPQRLKPTSPEPTTRR